MADEIGGYFARLRLIVDQDDFNTGIRTLSAMEYEIKQTSEKTSTAKNNWKEFVQGLAASIYTIKQIASAIKDMYQALDETNKVTAKNMGVGAEWNLPGTAVQKVGAAAQLTGANPQAVINSMTALVERMGRVKYGELNTGEVLAFKFLGLDWTKERNKKAPDLLRDLLGSLANIKPEDRPQALSSLEQIAGSDVKDMGRFLLSYGMSVSELFGTASKRTVTTDESNKGALDWTKESNEFKTFIDSLKSWGFGELGGKLAPLLKDITEFLAAHLDTIEAAFLAFADFVGAVAKPFIAGAKRKVISEEIDRLTASTSGELMNLREKRGENVFKTGFKPLTKEEYKALSADPSIREEYRKLVSDQLSTTPFFTAKDVHLRQAALRDASFLDPTIKIVIAGDPEYLRELEKKSGLSITVDSKSGTLITSPSGKAAGNYNAMPGGR